MERTVGWFLLVLLAVAAASGMAGHVPARVRLLLLFPVAFGLLVGSAAGYLAAGLGLRGTVRTALLCGLLTVAGLANVARIAYGELAAQARRAVKEDPQRLLKLRLLEAGDLRDSRIRQHYHELRAAVRPTFGDYLASRFATMFGWQSPPWPALIWGGEVLVAGVAAAWTTRRLMSGVGRIRSSSNCEPLGRIEP